MSRSSIDRRSGPRSISVPARYELSRGGSGSSALSSSLNQGVVFGSSPPGGRLSSSAGVERWRSSDLDNRWEGMWARGLPPGQGFDKGRASPAFVQTLLNGKLEVNGKRVLVPGCGRGYDLVELARAGASQVIGLELAPTAVQRACEHVLRSLQPEEQARVACVHGDFFTHEVGQQQQLYDVGYDYTFLSSLPPAQHEAWAAAWARLLAPGSGLLTTLMFPVDNGQGTYVPQGVGPDRYSELLLAAGFECVHSEAVPPGQSLPGRDGREHLAIWRRRSNPEDLSEGSDDDTLLVGGL